MRPITSSFRLEHTILLIIFIISETRYARAATKATTTRPRRGRTTKHHKKRLSLSRKGAPRRSSRRRRGGKNYKIIEHIKFRKEKEFFLSARIKSLFRLLLFAFQLCGFSDLFSLMESPFLLSMNQLKKYFFLSARPRARVFFHSISVFLNA
jgi:hypothetical protein